MPEFVLLRRLERLEREAQWLAPDEIAKRIHALIVHIRHIAKLNAQQRALLPR